MRPILLLAVCACASAIRNAPPGYPFSTQTDAATLARREADAARIREAGWTLALDSAGFATWAWKTGATFHEKQRLGPLDDAVLDHLEGWVREYPDVFGIAGTADVRVVHDSEHPFGPFAQMCQHSRGRVVACIRISWRSAGYSNGTYTPEGIGISGHLWPGIELPDELSDRAIASLARTPPAPWQFTAQRRGGAMRLAEGTAQWRTSRGLATTSVGVQRQLQRVRGQLRMVAMVSDHFPGHKQWHFDAVTGERLEPSDVRYPY